MSADGSGGAARGGRPRPGAVAQRGSFSADTSAWEEAALAPGQGQPFPAALMSVVCLEPLVLTAEKPGPDSAKGGKTRFQHRGAQEER